MRGFGLGDDDEPARILIEAVHDARPPYPADPTKLGSAMRDQRVNKGAVRIPRGRVNNEAGRLVDDDEMCILVTDLERDRLGSGRRGFCFGQQHDKILAAANAVRRVAMHRTAGEDMTRFYQPFEPRAREFREVARQYPVETLPCVGNTSADLRGGCSELSRHVGVSA
jgi:hypothetical protein